MAWKLFPIFLVIATYLGPVFVQAQFGDKPSERRPSRNDLIVLVAHNDDPTDQMFIFFPEEPKVNLTIAFFVGSFHHCVRGLVVNVALPQVALCPYAFPFFPQLSFTLSRRQLHLRFLSATIFLRYSAVQFGYFRLLNWVTVTLVWSAYLSIYLSIYLSFYLLAMLIFGNGNIWQW